MSRVLGDKNEYPYAEELLPGKWVIRDTFEDRPVTKTPTDMESVLIDLCLENMRPLSKTKMREACLLCGDTKQQEIEQLKRELAEARQQITVLEVTCESFKGMLGEGGDDKKED
jgi:hypothetical protein